MTENRRHELLKSEFGIATRRRPIGRDYAAAKDVESGKSESRGGGLSPPDRRVLFLQFFFNGNSYLFYCIGFFYVLARAQFLGGLYIL